MSNHLANCHAWSRLCVSSHTNRRLEMNYKKFKFFFHLPGSRTHTWTLDMPVVDKSFFVLDLVKCQKWFVVQFICIFSSFIFIHKGCRAGNKWTQWTLIYHQTFTIECSYFSILNIIIHKLVIRFLIDKIPNQGSCGEMTL